MPERNALFECIDHFITRSRNKVAVNEREILSAQLDASPDTKLPFNLFNLREKASERSARGSDQLDFVGLAAKLSRLMHSGAFDEPRIRGIDVERMVQPGRVSIIDVSAADDAIQGLVTAAVLRKTFAHKLIRQGTPPTLLVIEEAHSFISREKVSTMQATLQMLRTVTRRGRKRWLSVAFVSQQPGHLPPEIFELCNTRVIHNLRSLHNLEALMSTAGDVSKGLWAHCPLLGPGEALLSSPQLRRPLLVQMRPACSKRRFTH
jgi:DNA helicase HerA-like ATPase